jgi:N-acetylgalactosamine kinase
MTAEIGEKSVEEYLSLTTSASRAANNVFLRRAQARHGSRQAALDAAREFAMLIEAFAGRFGKNRQVCLYESPGRVNLMGMHIDHRGGIVNPVATRQRIRAVVGAREDDLVCARSLSGGFGEGQFRVSERLPARPLRSLSEWLNWTEQEAVATGGGNSFINYFACGPLYAACFLYPWGRPFRGADFLLDSDLPPSAGLSSSSAVVVMATDCFLRSNGEGGEAPSLEKRLEVYGYGEWYIGTRGGTGDHAAIKLARRGAVQPIVTTPDLRVRPPAPIPEGYEIFLYQSGEAANKSVEPFKTAFNAPIISYQTAETMLTDYLEDQHPARLEGLLARRATLDPRHHRVYLGDVTGEALLSEAEIYQFLRTVPPAMRQEEVFSRLERRAETFRAGIQQATEPEGGYHVRDVAAFGFSECARASAAGELLAAGNMAGFAEMMNVSQLGDQVAEVGDEASRRIKFLDHGALVALEKEGVAVRHIAGDYHVSTPHVDRMVSIALSVSGVLGARLSGAGLGGMLIVLGKEGFDEALDPILQRDYYEPLKKDFRKIRIVPSEGAGFY